MKIRCKHFYIYKSITVFCFRQSILDQYVHIEDEPGSSTHDPLRMPIANIYKVFFLFLK
jgi:hypothetical protein